MSCPIDNIKKGEGATSHEAECAGKKRNVGVVTRPAVPRELCGFTGSICGLRGYA